MPSCGTIHRPLKTTPLDQQLMGVRPVYNSDRPEAHDILRHWRSIADTYDPPRLLIGETNVERLATLMEFYGNGHNELHGGFNFVFINAALEAGAMRAIVEDVEATLPDGAWPLWTGSNHDVSRLATRWAGADTAKVRCALMILLCLRGTPFLYQGDEIGLTDGPIGQADLRDRVGIRFWPFYKGRDAERTPMPWSSGPGGGFSDDVEVRPWLPMADPAPCNVEDQAADPDSVLSFTRRAIARRRDNEDLALGSYRTLPSPAHSWLFRRGLRFGRRAQHGRYRDRVHGVDRFDHPGHRSGARGHGRGGNDHPGAVERGRRRVVARPGRAGAPLYSVLDETRPTVCAALVVAAWALAALPQSRNCW